MLADVRLLNHDPSALVEPPQNSPAKIYILLKMAFEPCHTLLGSIDPYFTGHLRQDLRFQVWRIKLRVGRKGELLHFTRWPRNGARIAV